MQYSIMMPNYDNLYLCGKNVFRVLETSSLHVNNSIGRISSMHVLRLEMQLMRHPNVTSVPTLGITLHKQPYVSGLSSPFILYTFLQH